MATIMTEEGCFANQSDRENSTEVARFNGVEDCPSVSLKFR